MGKTGSFKNSWSNKQRMHVFLQQFFFPWSSAFNHFVFIGLQTLSLTTIPSLAFFIHLRFLWLAGSPIMVSSSPSIAQTSKFNFSKIQLRHVKTRIQEYIWVFRFKSSLPMPYLKQKIFSTSQLWLAMLQVKLHGICVCYNDFVSFTVTFFNPACREWFPSGFSKIDIMSRNK